MQGQSNEGSVVLVQSILHPEQEVPIVFSYKGLAQKEAESNFIPRFHDIDPIEF